MIRFRTHNATFSAGRKPDGSVLIILDDMLDGTCVAGTEIQLRATLTRGQFDAVILECSPTGPEGT